MIKYKTLQEIYKEQFSIDGLEMNDVFKLFNLVGFLYKSYKQKDENLTVYALMYKILKKKTFNNESKTEEWEKVDSGSLDYFVVPFSIQLEFYFDKGDAKPTNYGLKTVKDIVNEINLIYDRWLPF